MNRIFACRLSSYGDYAEEAWEHLPALGIENIEAPVPETKGEKDTLRRRLKQSGLTVTSFQGDCDIHRIDPGENMRGQLEACAEFDVPICFASVKAGQLDLEDTARRLRYVGDVAAGVGVAIALETHPDLATNGSVALRTMQAINHPNIRVNFDTGNIYFYNRHRTAEDELAKILDFVVAVHLKDTTGAYRKFRFPALGAGVVNFPEIFAMLDRRDFAGPYTLELEGMEGVEYSREDRLAYVESSVTYLRDIGVLDGGEA
jgi:sugar phosphate isomerase/epimerase